MIILGIDVGTTTVCGVAIDADKGNLLRAKTVANDGALAGAPFERLQNAERIYDICKALYDDLLNEYPTAAAAGVTGQMHGILYVNERGEAISPLYTWQDGRGKLVCKSGRTYAEELSARTGYPAATGYGTTTMFYNEQNGLTPKGAAKVCTVHDYVAMKLCGNALPLTHPSDAASLGLFDIDENKFDAGAIERAGISSSLLPEVREISIIGCTKKNVPVCVAIGDNQASVLGSLKEGDVLANVGTGSQVSAVCDKAEGKTGVEYRPYVENKFLATGCALAGGYSYSLLKNFFAQTLALFGAKFPDDGYARMNEAAARAGEDGILCTPLFCGTREDGTLRAKFENVGAENFTPAHLARAVLQGICDELHEKYLAFGFENPPRRLIGSGNGFRKNPLLAKLFSHTFKMPLAIPAYEEEAAFGAALAATMAIGGKSLKEVQQAIRYTEGENYAK